MKAIRISQYGGAEVLSFEDIDVADPGEGQVRITIEAAGVNFIDTYHRTGLYPLNLPLTLGLEGAGIVHAVGAGVSDLTEGDRVAWKSVEGSYAEQVVAAAAEVVKIPSDVATKTAAAVMLQGLTSHYLVNSTYPIREGDTCLVHAAAGGVGLLLVQMAKMRGARVIGTTSTEEKAALARGAGADDIVLYTERDFEAEVLRLTDGQGVEVVYDSVAQATWEKSINCLKPRGYMVFFGNASGPVPPIDPLLLSQKGSIYLTRPTLNSYTQTREEYLQRTSEVMGWIQDGSLDVRIGEEHPLENTAEAHKRLEGRQTTGKVLLIP
ncbi:MAG: quinone oxidoreductase [Gemmatimonadetes bacterium]|nr:quinone oxidoreductase [Gemmatimonadota bacterium]MXZ11323.1 quinone oxidoreductase [Gemmatimonadota bacterium]MYB55304.1 quinone oxidoreductase [Gemmatimonadota bacterium]MYC12177.1 quinone oxidoreductase [Gemmatimonadota bacterium]MYK51410.1 quinone oxidoreductase [Gemmatimonadota bacterium]